MANAKEVKSQEEPIEKQLWKAADKLRKNIDAAMHWKNSAIQCFQNLSPVKCG